MTALSVLLAGAPSHAVTTAPADSAEPPGLWLVDRASTFALCGTRQPTPAEADYVLLWMRAAATVSPDLPDAWLWQFDLLSRLGRTPEALKAIDEYCRLVPDDVVARLDRIDLGFQACQTLDARADVCRERLDEPGNPPAVVSDLHRRLAELARRQGDDAGAREHAQASIEAFRYNLPARALLIELEEPADAPAAQVRLLLDSLAYNPARGEAIWNLARYLDDLSLHDRAVEWYRRLIDDIRRRQPGAQPPPALLTALAASYGDAGRLEDAFETCNQAMAADPALLDAQILMIRIARLRGLREVADQQRDRVATRLMELEPAILQNRDVAAAVQSAWFHIEYKPDFARAVRLARSAVEWAPDDPEARRCLDRATLADSNPATATAPLGPSTHKPDRHAVIEALDAFDKAVLSFPDDPTAALQLKVTPASTKVVFGQPMFLTFTLSNRGSYAVTLGAEGMVADPRVIVTVTGPWGGERPVRSILSISLMRTGALLPGESIVVRQSVNVGPVATVMEMEPQRETLLTFSCVFDPVVDEKGQWTSRWKALQPEPVRITRKSVDAAGRGLATLTAATTRGTEAQRAQAVNSLGSLIAERRRAQTGPLDYTALSVDDAAIERTLLAALRDPSPLVRARTVDTLALLKLERRVIDAAAPLLADPNPLVRMLAVDLFANAQGQVFEPVATRLSAADPDPLVKALAEYFRQTWQSATTQPQPSM